MTVTKRPYSRSDPISSFWRRAELGMNCHPFTLDEGRVIQRALRNLVRCKPSESRVHIRCWAFEKLRRAMEKYDLSRTHAAVKCVPPPGSKGAIASYRKASLQALRNWQKNPHLVREPIAPPAIGKPNPFLLLRFGAHSVGINIDDPGWIEKLQNDQYLFARAVDGAKQFEMFTSPKGVPPDEPLQSYYDEAVEIYIAVSGKMPGRSVGIENSSVENGAPYGPTFEFFRAITPSEITEPTDACTKDAPDEGFLQNLQRPTFTEPTKPSDQTIDGRMRQAIKRTIERSDKRTKPAD